jgi:hypothetical protein
MSQQSHVCDAVSEFEGFFDIDRAEDAISVFSKSNSDSSISCSTRADVQKRIIARLSENKNIHSPSVLWNDCGERLKPAERGS